VIKKKYKACQFSNYGWTKSSCSVCAFINISERNVLSHFSNIIYLNTASKPGVEITGSAKHYVSILIVFAQYTRAYNIIKIRLRLSGPNFRIRRKKMLSERSRFSSQHFNHHQTTLLNKYNIVCFGLMTSNGAPRLLPFVEPLPADTSIHDYSVVYPSMVDALFCHLFLSSHFQKDGHCIILCET